MPEIELTSAAPNTRSCRNAGDLVRYRHAVAPERGGEWQLGRVRVFTTTPTADRTTRSPRAVGGGELRCPPACSCTVEAILYFKLANEIAASWAEVGEKGAIYKGRVRFPFRAAAAS